MGFDCISSLSLLIFLLYNNLRTDVIVTTKSMSEVNENTTELNEKFYVFEFHRKWSQ